MVTTKNHVSNSKRKRSFNEFVDSMSKSQRFAIIRSSKSQCTIRHSETILNVDKATISSEATCVTNNACVTYEFVKNETIKCSLS
ncbi:hypothetical protein HanRHA438_Chr17g0820091 [Helianthus annuus]|nr:hypothetical protein HanRHA438_Chr17g0820091 [Helianthus annuus]